MATYFISDLHLAAQATEISQRFINFLNTDIEDAKALYILGDLFEYWIGDDAAEVVEMSPILEKLKTLSDRGIQGYFLAGNRDFLIGQRFSDQTGFKILDDFTVISLYDIPTLLLHGDALCTDDKKHQLFRQQIMTNKDWHESALQKPVEERISIAKEMRSMSNDYKKTLDDSIMDVNKESVINAFRQYKVQHMIHGHTHRPNIHQHKTPLGNAQRIVLGDWYTQLSYLKVTPDKQTFISNGNVVSNVIN